MGIFEEVDLSTFVRLKGSDVFTGCLTDRRFDYSGVAAELFLPPSLGLLLQDAPLSDCTDTIDGLDGSEGSYSPAKSIRKVLAAPVLACMTVHCTSGPV